MRACRIENSFVPVEPLLNTAIRFRLRRSSACMILQFQRHHMLRVPELARSAVCNSCERAATRWPPIRCEDRLPYYKHPHPSAGLPRQQLLSCGGPPQTSRSSRRQEQNQPRNVGFGIEGTFELPEISIRECDNWRLAAWRRAGTPQIGSRQQYKDCSYRHAYEPFFHFPENLSAMNAAISCGNRIIPNTTTRAVHSSAFPIMRPRIEHCLARCCCQNPKPSSATDSPKSHGTQRHEKPTCRSCSQRRSKAKWQTTTDRRDGTQNRSERCRNACALFQHAFPSRASTTARRTISTGGSPISDEPGYKRQLKANPLAWEHSPATSRPLMRIVGEP